VWNRFFASKISILKLLEDSHLILHENHSLFETLSLFMDLNRRIGCKGDQRREKSSEEHNTHHVRERF
jgi:hypothetical protein